MSRWNASGVPDASAASRRAIASWRTRRREEIESFTDDGCGCCVHVIAVRASEAAIDELENLLGGQWSRTRA